MFRPTGTIGHKRSGRWVSSSDPPASRTDTGQTGGRNWVAMISKVAASPIIAIAAHALVRMSPVFSKRRAGQRARPVSVA